MSYKNKYLKYKMKYLNGGAFPEDRPILDIFKQYFQDEKKMTVEEAFKFLLELKYNKKKDKSYDDKGLTNPIIIGDYVYRVGGTRSYSIYYRPKLGSETVESIANEADDSKSSFSMSDLPQYKAIYTVRSDGW